MNLLNTIIVGLKEIWAHKFRSMLTMLGIILGVASLVGMAAIVTGMENGLKETMIAMGGADKVLLEEQDVPAYQEHLAEEAPGRTMVDVMALRRSAPLIRFVSPEMALNNCTITRGDKMVNPSECVGVWPAPKARLGPRGQLGVLAEKLHGLHPHEHNVGPVPLRRRGEQYPRPAPDGH